MPRFTSLANRLGGRYTWQATGKHVWISMFEVEFEGSSIRVEPATGSKGALIGADFHVRIANAFFPATTMLTRESRLDRLGKRMRINREFQTGDAAFDERVYVDSPAQDGDLWRLLASQAVREAIVSMLDEERGLGVHLQISAAREGEAPQREPGIRMRLLLRDFEKTEAIRRSVRSLFDLAKAFEQEAHFEQGPYGRAAGAHAAPEPPLTTRWGRVTLALSMALVPLAYAVVGPSDRTFGSTTAIYGVAFAFVLWVLSFFFYAALFRGRSSSLTTVLGFTFLSLGFFPFGIVFAAHVNTAFDGGRETTERGSAHYQTQSKGPGYVSVRADWLRGAPTARYHERFPLTTSDGEVPVFVVVKPGAFGVPWIVTLSR